MQLQWKELTWTNFLFSAKLQLRVSGWLHYLTATIFQLSQNLQPNCEQWSLTPKGSQVGFVNPVSIRRTHSRPYKPETFRSSSNMAITLSVGEWWWRKRMDVLPPILFATRHEKKWATVNANTEKSRDFGCGCTAKTGGRQWFWNSSLMQKEKQSFECPAGLFFLWQCREAGADLPWGKTRRLLGAPSSWGPHKTNNTLMVNTVPVTVISFFKNTMLWILCFLIKHFR